jgi:hypothetical protein
METGQWLGTCDAENHEPVISRPHIKNIITQ